MRAGSTILVVGGGLAGVTCARALGEQGIRVVLVDRNNYTQFQPLLYQVATAGVTPSGVARPLRELFRKQRSVEVKMADVSAVDPVARTVACADGTTFAGDHVVLATGSVPNFFGTPGAEDNAFPLYALIDAVRLRSRIFEVFEDADRNPKLIDRGALNLVVVGAGATGVETAGALADLVNDVMPGRFHDLGMDAARIHVVDPGANVLGPFSDQAHEYARRALERKGVHLHLGTSVTAVHPDRVVLSDGRTILTRTVVWAGGIQAAAADAAPGLPHGHGGRIDVDAELGVPGFPGVWAVGDAANIAGSDGRPLPQLGSVALQAGQRVAENILADLDGRPRSPFRYKDKGIMAMIGKNAAVAEMGASRREIHGVPAFAAWLGVHAMLLTGFRERVTALRSWAWDYFSENRAPSLIEPSLTPPIDWDATADEPVTPRG